VQTPEQEQKLTISPANLFAGLPETLAEELFTELARGEHVRVERIVSKGHSSPASGWYDQQAHEWVVVLQGEATIAFENNGAVQLRRGDHLTIPAHTKHKVTWTTPDAETIWLAVHYS
jgi:cupin 2 domain-containing protein